MNKMALLSISICISLVAAVASAVEDREFHHYGCSATAVTAANDLTSKMPSSVTGTYWISQDFATTAMGSAYEIVMRNRDDGRCVLIQVSTLEGATDCRLLSTKVTQLASLPAYDIRSICKR